MDDPRVQEAPEVNVRLCAWVVAMFLGREGCAPFIALSKACDSALPFTQAFNQLP